MAVEKRENPKAPKTPALAPAENKKNIAFSCTLIPLKS